MAVVVLTSLIVVLMMLGGDFRRTGWKRATSFQPPFLLYCESDVDESIVNVSISDNLGDSLFIHAGFAIFGSPLKRLPSIFKSTSWKSQIF
ncbi:hypothetical protein BpHYR1_043724 [Brachionus plicatilis]|uniref:Uncharacterized protein n=1 Tax=Brachionus plicatilis TaxID=10195 RepID=A0A3M7PPL7_BRAPC|nr:hypothetical protein BpHYR1_043724 [Brachionus plicatilis]